MSEKNGKDKIIDKIRKLLSLAGQNDSPNEAASAAAMAQRLMERHAIEMADVEAGSDEVDEEIERFSFDPFRGPLQKKSTWQGALANVIAKAHGCYAIWSGSRLVIAGRKSDVLAAREVRDYCHREIDRLTAKYASGMGRGYGVSFRMGCVEAIKTAIWKERHDLQDEMRGKVSEKALVVVDTRTQDARSQFGKLRESKGPQSVNVIAYLEGNVAGRDVYAGTKKRIEG